jgi:hypothetical protein
MSIESIEYLMGRWRPEIGDPSFMGWFTVGSYFLCVIVALMAARSKKKAERKVFSFWMIVALLMIFLGINKQLDLQSLFTEIGRQIAKKQGWMEERRIVQFWFIVLFGSVAIGGFLLFAIIWRDFFRRFKLAWVGLFFILSFIVIRAASFHHFEEVLASEVLGARMNWVLELTGIYLIAAAGIKEMRTLPRKGLSPFIRK